jgi:hypothetical protein
MSKNVTLLTMRTRARQRADQENSGFITDPELNYLLNVSCAELYDLLVSAYDDEYFSTTQDISTVSGTESYALSSTFYKLLGVDLVLSSSQISPMKKFTFGERSQYKSALFNAQGSDSFCYRLNAGNILLSPIPSSVRTVRVTYVPAMTTLALDGDTFDGINGWEEYAIIDAAIKMKIKEDSGIQELVYEKNSILARIKSMRHNRDAGDPARITNTRGRSGRLVGGH